MFADRRPSRRPTMIIRLILHLISCRASRLGSPMAKVTPSRGPVCKTGAIAMGTRRMAIWFQQIRCLFSVCSRFDLTILAINTLDHFDRALYTFLAPMLAPLFFPGHDPMMQLILAYSVMATSLLTRPIGVWLFSCLLIKTSPRYALNVSLGGIGLFTMCYGFLPSYDQVGIMAPFFLVLMRMIRSIFGAGERSIAKLYLLEDKSAEKAMVAASLYQSASMLGMLMASVTATLWICLWGGAPAWRLSFIMAGLLSLCLLSIRSKKSGHEVKAASAKTISQAGSWINPLPLIAQQWRTLIPLIITSGLSQFTYLLPFVLLNSLIPLVTQVSFQEMVVLNTGLLMFDFALMMWLGQALRRFAPAQVMLCAASVLMLSLPLLFMILPGAIIETVTAVRLWIVFWGVVFSCPITLYHKQLFHNHPHLYFLCGMGNAVGGALFGKVGITGLLWLWHETHSFLTLGIALSSIAGLCCLYLKKMTSDRPAS